VVVQSPEISCVGCLARVNPICQSGLLTCPRCGADLTAFVPASCQRRNFAGLAKKISILLVVAASAGGVLLLLLLGKPLQYSFDGEAWMQYSGSMEAINPRGHMFEALRNKLLADTPKREEVLIMLGPPDCGQSSEEVRYVLGMWTAFGMDHDCAHIYFDESGRVKEVVWWQH
jgi:hypothetical protein